MYVLNISVDITSGTSTSWSGDSPPSSLVFLFLLLRTLWMKFLWKSQMYKCLTCKTMNEYYIFIVDYFLQLKFS